MPLEFGPFFLVAGIVSLAVARFVDFQRADRHPVWQWFTRPYALLDVKWIAGGRRRYFYLMGGLFVGIGLLVLLRRPSTTDSERSSGATIRFMVVDSASHSPLARASIVLRGFGYGSLTDSAGDAWIFHVPPGTYPLGVLQRCPLMLSAPFAITVTDDSAQAFRIVMAPRRGCVDPKVVV